MDRLQWLEARRAGLGSSDAPAIVGQGFRDAGHVYRSKVEPAADAEPTGVLALGLALEDHVAGLYAREMGCDLSPGAMTDHPQRPWQIASPDRLRPDGVVVELKTTGFFGDEWGEPGTDEIPPGYLVQAQHQLGVLGRDLADLAAMSRVTGELRVYRVPFDPAFFAWLTRIESEFWHQHVLARVPPGAEWERQFDDGIPLPPVKGKAVELGPAAAALLARRATVGAVRKEIDAEYDRLTRELTLALGDAEVGTCPGWKLKRIAVAESTFTTTRKASVRLDVRAVKH